MMDAQEKAIDAGTEPVVKVEQKQPINKVKAKLLEMIDNAVANIKRETTVIYSCKHDQEGQINKINRDTALIEKLSPLVA
jgi:hypothetical protein